jgi:hypothetical protein
MSVIDLIFNLFFDAPTLKRFLAIPNDIRQLTAAIALEISLTHNINDYFGTQHVSSSLNKQ